MIEVVPIRVIRRRTVDALNEAFCKAHNGAESQLFTNHIEELADLIATKLQETLESATGVDGLLEFIDKVNEEYNSLQNYSIYKERVCNFSPVQTIDTAYRDDYFDMYGDYDLPFAAFLVHNRIVKIDELLNMGYESIVTNAAMLAIELYFDSDPIDVNSIYKAIVCCFSALLIAALFFIKRSEVLGSDRTCLAYAVKRASLPSVILPLPKEGKPVNVDAIVRELPCISTPSGYACTQHLKHSPRECSFRIDRRCNLANAGGRERIVELLKELDISGLIESREGEGGEDLYVYLVY